MFHVNNPHNTDVQKINVKISYRFFKKTHSDNAEVRLYLDTR